MIRRAIQAVLYGVALLAIWDIFFELDWRWVPAGLVLGLLLMVGITLVVRWLRRSYYRAIDEIAQASADAAARGEGLFR